MTIKFFQPTDPKISSEETELWFRKTMRITAIEEIEGSPSAFFILEIRPELRHNYQGDNFQVVVKHKNFNKTYFANYDLANEVISKIKEKL
jgi:hypothetical protein